MVLCVHAGFALQALSTCCLPSCVGVALHVVMHGFLQADSFILALGLAYGCS
jgi:hypothetical protein